jgi:hypothetical protein
MPSEDDLPYPSAADDVVGADPMRASDLSQDDEPLWFGVAKTDHRFKMSSTSDSASGLLLRAQLSKER